MNLWATAADRPAGFADVWHASCAADGVDIDALTAVLDAVEIARADRYRFERDRRQFILARGALRCLLGSYLGLHPRAVRLFYGSHGKPCIEGDLQFNVAHSHGFVAIAIATANAVGIDVEKIDESIDVMELADGFYARGETENLRRLGGVAQIQGFFRCWSRKEAYLKAIGDGLSRPLGDFEVATGETSGSALLRVDWDPAEVARWHLADIPLDPGFASALAIEGGPFELRVRPIPVGPWR